MAGSSIGTVGSEVTHDLGTLARDRGVGKLAERLYLEFGVTLGIHDPAEGIWLATIGKDAPTVLEPPSLAERAGVGVSCRRSMEREDTVRLVLPLPAALGGARRYAVMIFAGATSPWTERAIAAWGEQVALRFEAEAALRASSQAPRTSTVVDRLIRRLRVSDAPERFQKRATMAVRDALELQAVAWIPGSSRAPIVSAGEVPGMMVDEFRAIAHEGADDPLRICEDLDAGALLRRFIVASADSQGEAGWLLAANPRDDRPFTTEPDLIATVASLIATQRSNARIYGDLKELLFGVIRSLTAAIDAKDRYTSGHSERVARIAVRIGQQLGMTPHEQGDLYLMGLLHDVGKIGVEDGVLKKPGKLTPDEYRQVQAHVRIGVHILSDLKKLQHLLPGVAFHHENLDGTGYPSGLKGDAIPLPARILAVADAFDAMSSSRPYRRRLSPSQIDEVFQKGSGVQWDPRIVKALIESRDDLDRIRQKGLGESLYQVINETLERS